MCWFFCPFCLHDFCVCACTRLCSWLTGLCVSHYFPTLWNRVSHRPPSMSLSSLLLSIPLSLPFSLPQSLSFLSLSLFLSAPVLSTAAPAVPISAQFCWLEPMLHLACPCKGQAGPTQGRLPWSGEAESKRMRQGLWAGERPTGLQFGSKKLTHY